ncbi:unnamed protein product [Caenorhabditis brenneri]
MVSLILSAVCFAVVAAGAYEAPAADNTYNRPSYGGGGYGSYPIDDYSHSHEHKKRVHKLKNLHGTGITEAEIKYYKHDGDHYAQISCPGGSTVYTWILADSDETIPSFGQPNTVALAGGINIEFVAKYSHKKWTGNDFFNDQRRKFRRVGCFTGTFETKVNNPTVVDK